MTSSRPAALVTGARRGIGRAIAVALARSGFAVAVLDLTLSEELAATVQQVGTHGIGAVPVAADISDLSAHDGILDATEAALGPLTCLVNNAGVSVLSRGDLLEVTAASYDRCQNVNTRGTFFLTQRFARRLVERGASEPGGPHRSIITISSSNAVAASISRGEYCISKAALSMASTLFAVRLAEHGIGVYDVQPGLIDTAMTAPSRSRYDADIERGLTAVKRWGAVDEVARVVATLARGDLPYTVGQKIQVDGGLLIPKF
jgi:NAD(P)-dependent dehydrogenase (short-subunit alcohol dehydrogenase family)